MKQHVTPSFIQLHALIPYGISNPNRDDLGSPKTAIIGGTTRLRISSQCLKRSLRQTTFSKVDAGEKVGVRTKKIGIMIRDHLLDNGASGKDAEKVALKLMTSLTGSKPKKAAKTDSANEEAGDEKALTSDTLIFYSPAEIAAIMDGAVRMHEGKIDKLSLKEVTNASDAIDIAAFGRMLASDKSFNVDAAIQVSHAFTTHKSVTQDDYFAAIDDINDRNKGGSAHIGEHEFGSGLFYQYVCIDSNALVRNLGGDETLARKAVKALIQGFVEGTPTGKQNSYANHPSPFYVRVETGSMAPRDLSGAFFRAVSGEDILSRSIESLEETSRRLSKQVGRRFESEETMNLVTGEGNLEEIVKVACAAVISPETK